MWVFSGMIKEGVMVNDFIFVSLLVSCGNVEDLCFGKLIYGLIIKYGYEFGIFL